MTVLTCAQLQTQVGNDVMDTQPPVLQLAMQIFALAPQYTAFAALSGGFVYEGNYGSPGPQFSPASAGAIAIDSVTLRQWQWANSEWS
jgi:hypothetical protein